MRFIKTFLVVVLLIVTGTGVWIWSGAYTIGADDPHWGVTERAISVLRNRSIQTHAQGVAVPNLDDPKYLGEGAEHYAAMCTGCHLAPGMHDSQLRDGLYPTPPKLAEIGARDPAQAFWIIKHGVKLTAMPAWGKSHDDNAIWGLVAFVRKLPQMTPEQYQQATAASDEHANHHHHDEANSSEEHEHGHTDDHEPNAQDSHGSSGSGADALRARQADVHAHGNDVMPFSLNATQHVFEKTPAGGVQRVVAREGHAEQVPLIRAHLSSIAQAFTARDFSGPMRLHGDDMPGLAELKAAPAGTLTVTYRDIGNGGEVSYEAKTEMLRNAIHRWFDAQLSDHGHDATDPDEHQHHGT